MQVVIVGGGIGGLTLALALEINRAILEHGKRAGLM